MRVFLIAGEPSGDRLGASLMAGLKGLRSDIQFHGVGGPLMQGEGMESQFPMEELSVMGIAEVLPKYRHLKRRISETADAVVKYRPDALITIDSPDFCLRVARLVKEASDIRTVHYVAPSVWAWRPGRAVKMAKVIDQVLALLPFEPPLMEAAGMRCDFVGHPVVSEPIVSDSETQRFRIDEGLGQVPLILVLPGSRQGEVQRLCPIFGDALQPVLQAHPDARVIVPTVAPVADRVQAAVKNWPGNPILLDPRNVNQEEHQHRKRLAFAAADAALAASGTVSLELAAARTPMVVAYDMKWLSWQIMSRMVRIDTVTLVNLVVGKNIVPEFLGPKCLPAAIADALHRVLTDDGHRQEQISAMAETMRALGQGGLPPGKRAALAVLDGLAKG